MWKTRRSKFVRSLAIWLLVAVGVAGTAFLYQKTQPFSAGEEKLDVLDPAQVIVLRTAGGFLEVATLVRNEEFRWRSTYTCVWIECGERIGQVRLPVSYTYRVRLAETWTLKLVGNEYVLSVPPPEPLLPPGINISKAEFTSERGGLIAPSVLANREVLLKNLGPELAQRAQKPQYLNLQLGHAEATVKEFAERWIREQGGPTQSPIRVEFRVEESN